MARTGRGALRPLWAAAYRAVTRLVSRYVTRGENAPAVYLHAGADEDFLPGLSDVDLTIVAARDPRAPGAAAQRIRRRWRRLSRLCPPVALLVDEPRVLEDEDLAELSGASALTVGLETPGGVALYHGRRATLDTFRVAGRPGLYSATADWTRVSGPERRPAEVPRDRQDTRIAAWLELAFWWRWAFRVCASPAEPRASDICVKLVAEPARIWLWLAHGERPSGRLAALRRAAELLPAHERALRWALDLNRGLPAAPGAPLVTALPALVELSALIAAALAAEAAEHGHTEVRLVGIPREGPPPLADWRGLAFPSRAEEVFEVVPGEPGDPALVGRLAAAATGCARPTICKDDLLVRPAAPLEGSRLRNLECPLTDPVSFALLRGRESAAFPCLRGWSAEDTARRAVAEHSHWLASPESEGASVESLLAAARAALFWESFQAGRPELILTLDETARRLEGRAVTDLPAFSRATAITPQPTR